MSKSKQSLVVLDLDDTVMEFSRHLIETYKNMTQEDCPALTTWNLEEDVENVLRKAEKKEFYGTMKPTSGAVEFIKEMKIRDIEVIYLTARPEEYDENTSYSLCKHGIYREIIYNKNKLKELKRLSQQYNILAFVDDRAYYIEEASGAGIQSYIRTVGHNKDHKYEKRVDSLMEILNDIY